MRGVKIASTEKNTMDRPDMRRKDRRLSDEESAALLARGEYGVMAAVDPKGLPYGVPLSYVWRDGLVYFHSALQGYKIDSIRANGTVAFTVVGHTRPVYEKNFTTWYESVMVFGQVAEIADPDEKYAILHALAEKYLPDHMDKAEEDIKRSLPRTLVYAITPERITGKARRPAPAHGA